MPPSHPRPEDLAALGGVVSATAEHAATAGEQLLDHMVTVGDHSAQAVVDSLIDEAVDVLRELSASCRELSLSLNALAGPVTRTDARDEHQQSARTKEVR